MLEGVPGAEHDLGDTTAAIDPAGIDPELGSPDLAAGDVPVLVETRGTGVGTRYPLDRPETRVGRHPDADIFLDDVTVSRRHALLTAVEGRLLLTDQGSLNGTYVAGERVDSRILAHGDEVQVGRFRFVFLEPGGTPPAIQLG
jgi:pSer/pThr/pTyr-binding forkhead associated (FHA) protein